MPLKFKVFMKKKVLMLLSALVLTNCEAIFVENISDKKITIVSPANKVKLDDPEIVFSWNKLDDVDVYHLKVITPNFSNITKTVLDTVIAKSLFSKKLSSGDYEWSIIGKNSEYQTQETRSSFTIN
ncbi:Putative uncharacterized domain protein (fragment) [Tenacibaculum ascidiaceicola]